MVLGEASSSLAECRNVVRMLAHKIEPPVAVVASTARADPALALAADPGAASSAPQVAAEAAEGLRSMAATLERMPAKERHPARRTRLLQSENGHQTQSWSSSPPLPTSPPRSARRPMIVELDDEEIPSEAELVTDGSSASMSGQDVELISVGTVAALTAAAYAEGADLHGAGGLPGWSSPEAAEAALDLVRRAFSRDGSASCDPSARELDENVRNAVAWCLSEAAPVLAHCLAPEPERRWGDEVGGDDHAPRLPVPVLPKALTDELQPASAEAALVASVRMRWMIETAGYPCLGRVEGIVSRVVPCVLRAIDHRSSSVRREGCAALAALVAATSRAELRWHADALVDAASSTLEGSTPEMFGAAAAAHARIVLAVCSDDFRDPLLATALGSMIEAAASRSHEPAVAAGWVLEAPKLIFASKLCVAAHLERLLPPLLGWLHARADATAIGACECLELTCKMAWPRMYVHAASLWPDVARSYCEADARESTVKLRAALKRVVALVQLAAGESFEAAWRRSGDEPTPTELAPLISYLEGLPRRVASTEWERP